MKIYLAVATAAVLLVACSTRQPAVQPAAGRAVTYFTGVVDVASGTMTITRVGGPSALATLAEGGAGNTVSVVNASAPAQDASCPGAAVSFTGHVSVASHYGDQVLRNVYAVIDSVSGQTGVGSCNGAADPGGLAPATGILWSYGSIAAQGTRTLDWHFALPNATHFTFTGHIVGDLVASASCTPVCGAQACGADDGCGGNCASGCPLAWDDGAWDASNWQ